MLARIEVRKSKVPGTPEQVSSNFLPFSFPLASQTALTDRLWDGPAFKTRGSATSQLLGRYLVFALSRNGLV
jgi:hypothetical protein